MRFGKGMSGVANQILGGWSAQGILSMEDGFPFGVGCQISTNNYPSSNNCVPDLVPGQNLYAHQGPDVGLTHFLNAAAFADPPVATAVGQTDFAPFGGRPKQVHGPQFEELDFSLFKNFRTTERTHLEFRGEFFNLFNHPNFGDPGSLNFLSPSTFAQITSTRGIPREVQLALKFYW
jgi:hypothetical protein